MADDELGTMNQFEAEPHSFIIRLWREHPGQDRGKRSWRGRVEHVQSGRSQYFNNLDDLPDILHQQTGLAEDLDNVFEPQRRDRSES